MNEKSAVEELARLKLRNKERAQKHRAKIQATETNAEKEARLKKKKEQTASYRAKLTDTTRKELNKKHQQDYREKHKKVDADANKKEVEKMAKELIYEFVDKAPHLKIVNGQLKLKRGRKVK